MSRKACLMKSSKFKLLGVKLDQEEWRPFWDVDDKVDNFTSIAVQLLDETLPVTTVRTHSSDNPWKTSHIKKEIKARQKPFQKEM